MSAPAGPPSLREDCDAPRDLTLDMQRYLIAFKDGSYKKVTAIDWKHSQWIHFTLPNQSIVRVNPDNVNYIHQGVWD